MHFVKPFPNLPSRLQQRPAACGGVYLPLSLPPLNLQASCSCRSRAGCAASGFSLQLQADSPSVGAVLYRQTLGDEQHHLMAVYGPRPAESARRCTISAPQPDRRRLLLIVPIDPVTNNWR